MSGYPQALASAAWYQLQSPGHLLLKGPDRHAFLQRQTTNDLGLLSPGSALVTVLTSPAARILDVLTLLETGEAIKALTLPGHGAETARYLRSRIFFNDKVTLEDVSQAFAQIHLLGPASDDVLRRIGFQALPRESEVLSAEAAGSPARLLVQRGFGYLLLLPAQVADAITAALEAQGAAQLTFQAYATLRLEAGLPSAGQELTEAYTPLEVDLDWAISSTKGCYTGQEVIARQLTYDKVARHLVGLRLLASASPGERLSAPEDDRPVGEITSSAISPRFGPIALGVVRRPYNEPGTPLAVGAEPGSPQTAVVPLPFQGEPA